MDCRVKPGNDEEILLKNPLRISRRQFYHLPMSCWVYILASRPGGTLYVGVTNDLVRRVYEHREGQARGFTKYNVKMLVYFEPHDAIATALHREQYQTLVAKGRST
jgi:predicted GIY-YIG superfamily endonuclease